jgi:hypothetical protein
VVKRVFEKLFFKINLCPLEGDSDAVTSSRKGIEEAMIEKELV